MTWVVLVLYLVPSAGLLAAMVYGLVRLRRDWAYLRPQAFDWQTQEWFDPKADAPRTVPEDKDLSPPSMSRTSGQRGRHIVAAVLLFYAMMTLAGVELGYRFAVGSHDRRLLIALFCGLAGYGLAYVVVTVALVVAHARRPRG
jgi:hypothetical protein